MSFIEYATDGATLTSRPAKQGEGDAIRSLNPGTRRRLIGAGFMGPHGVSADVFAEIINDRLGKDFTPCEAVDWLAKWALLELDERQREAQAARRERRARNLGLATFFAYRNHRAIEAGHGSFWQMRKQRWPDSCGRTRRMVAA